DCLLLSGLLSIAAVYRVVEHALHPGLVDGSPEHPRRRPVVEIDLAGGQALQHLLALLLAEPIEGLAVALAAMGVGCLDAGAVELRRRERQLVALARHAGLPRSLHIQAVAPRPCPRQRARRV